jgi:hypothetical protein
MFKRFRLMTITIALIAGMVASFAPMDALNGVDVAEAQSPVCTQTHIVQPGENLFRIGLRYGVSWPTLQAWNYLPNANQIRVGQRLCIDGFATAASPVHPTPPPSQVVFPGNPFGPTTEPRIFFPQATLGQSFQLFGYNFPANRTVTIALTTLGNRPYVPYYTATTDANGEFFVQVSIPSALQNANTVAVEVTTSGGFFALNWFYN